jgi:hypothetical protein
MAWGAIQARLHRHEPDLLRAVYISVVEECRRMGAIPVYLYLPIPGTTTENPGPQFLALAEQAGFITCDLTPWSRSLALNELFRPGEALHPDERGHRRIAEALLRLVEERPGILPRAAD